MSASGSATDRTSTSRTGGSSAPRSTIDVHDLRSKVRDVYREVAERPDGTFHFEMGRSLAERLGYPPDELDHVPEEAVRSFAGVGHHLDLAGLEPGMDVLDAGSGSGMDSFLAARRVGPSGSVRGVDMTEEQLAKAEALRARHDVAQVSFHRGLLEELPFDADTFDVVLSNGVVNLAADKPSLFRGLARVVRPGGVLAISDIVCETALTDEIKCDTSLWAACIGGAAQQDLYRDAIAAAGFRIDAWRENSEYLFLSRSALGASEQFGVKSVSLRAILEA